MANSNPLPIVLSGVLGLLIGAGATYALQPTPEPPPAPETQAPIKDPTPCPELPKPTPQTDPTQQPSKELTQCTATLNRLKKAYAQTDQDNKDNNEIIGILEEIIERTGADTPDGKPMTTWPESIAKQFTPEGFENVLKDLKTKCPDLFPPSAKADCSEFPCTIAMTVDESQKEWSGTKSCSAYNAHFPNGNSTSGSTFKGPNGEKLHSMHVTPYPNDAESRDMMRKYEDNLHKRRRARHRDFLIDEKNNQLRNPCEQDRNADACAELGGALKRKDPDAAAQYTAKGCEYGSGNACNNAAWTRCHDNNVCDDTALEHAQRATELNPNDGKGAWDTLAFVLCKTGKVAEANDAYRRSCKEGYTANCSKTCSP